MPAIKLRVAFVIFVEVTISDQSGDRSIIESGSVTTEKLREQYGYNDATCRSRRSREGIPLKTVWTKDSKGGRCGEYTFDLVAAVDGGKIGGRKAFRKSIKVALILRDVRCSFCGLDSCALSPG